MYILFDHGSHQNTIKNFYSLSEVLEVVETIKCLETSQTRTLQIYCGEMDELLTTYRYQPGIGWCEYPNKISA